MATFPALVPAPYDLLPGEFPISETAAMDGRVSVVRHGNAEIGRTIALQFVALTEAEWEQIKDHYRTQQSTFQSFLFTTTTLAAADTPTGQSWVYAEQPQVEDRHDDIFDISCRFICQPRGGVLIGAVNWRSIAGPLTPGAFSGGQTPFANGVALVSPASTLTPARAVAGTLWAPTNMPNLDLFLNFTDASTLTVSSGSVSQADDQSPNGFDATQAVAGDAPTVSTGATGVACIATTANQYLTLAASLSSRYVVVVAEFTQPATADQFLVGDIATYDFHPPDAGGAQPDLLLHVSTSSASVRNGGGWMTGTKTAPLAMVKRSRPTAYEFTTTAAVSISQFSADRSNAYGDRGIIGKQYFILASDAIPSDADRWRLQGWIAHRLLVPGDLPANHPYRSTLPTV